MRLSITATIICFATSAIADFIIYSGTSTAFVEPGNPSLGNLYLLNGPPSCDDIINYVPITQQGNNDASSYGYAADMDNSVDPPIYKRLEIYDGADGPYTNKALGHITLYERAEGGGDGVYDILAQADGDSDSYSIGACQQAGDDADDYVL